MSVARSSVVLAGAALLAAACDLIPSPSRRAAAVMGDAPDTLGVVPSVRHVPTRARAALREASGAAASAAQPGVLFTVNDSGHEPLLFALDTTGADRGAWRLAGAANRDWEAVAVGPCGTAADAGAPAPGVPRCVYVGDVGDNDRRHASLTLYRVAEPPAGDSATLGTLPAERLAFRYPQGRHDVEALVVGADGGMLLVTKRPLVEPGGRRRPALVFALPATAWRHPDSLHVAALVDSLPIVPGTAIGRRVTDAALARDGRHLAVRTYTQVYVFVADPRTGRPRAGVAPTVCNVVGLDERQGEGIAWLGDRQLLTSEGRREPLRLIDCPLPRR